jgi:cytidylate kinase
MYRAAALATLQQSTSLSDDVALANLVSDARITVTDTPNGTRVHLNDEDVTDSLHNSEVEAVVSRVAAVAGVRTVLVEKQRAMAEPGSIVMVGRDIGTVVLADADIKVFLEASAEERARRRQAERSQSDAESSVASVQEKLEARDSQDKQRTESPLKPADDAHILVTDGLSIDQVVAEIVKLVTARE